VVYGSDFPNIPYRLENAVQAMRDLQLGRALEQKIFCTNAARLLGLDPEEVI
jgi:predicted TIM-barrel fold metal-dependent hydrolase